MTAQLLQIELNGAHNAYGGDRNKFALTTVEDESKIAGEIKALLKANTYVLVKYNGQLHRCELVTEGKYNRTAVNYHPYQDKFS